MKESQHSARPLHSSAPNSAVFSGVNSAVNIFRMGWNKLTTPLQHIKEFSKVIEIVENLKSDGCEIKVRLNGDSNTYTTRITAVNPEHRMLVIETLNPSDGGDYFPAGSTLSLEANNKGKKIDIPCQFIDELVPNLALGHQLKLPATVRH